MTLSISSNGICDGILIRIFVLDSLFEHSYGLSLNDLRIHEKRSTYDTVMSKSVFREFITFVSLER